VPERPAHCPRLTISFAMRAPDWGPSAGDLYAAALDMTAWAERVGFDEVRLSEHHETTDGYLPAPIVLAAGLGARTSTIDIKLFVVLATLQHPIHLAEDLAVADLVTGGRLHVTLGAGYRKDEFLLFDINWKRRPSMMVEIVETLRASWTGEPFEFRGRTTRVLPRPARPGGPPLSLAGASVGSAHRAAALHLPYEPLLPQFWHAYCEELARLGQPVPEHDPTHLSGPAFLHIARDPDAAWARVRDAVAHNSNEYARYAQRPELTPFGAVNDPDELRHSGHALVITPAECVELCRGIGPHGRLGFNPLNGGIEPDVAWESLDLFEREVLPALA
jgi:alkanesulfonate monooxygenase SsuD/methylene tetrahydromethanopterin reductase-like flavin-dependent oxidoreductase (luciferase family)